MSNDVPYHGMPKDILAPSVWKWRRVGGGEEEAWEGVGEEVVEGWGNGTRMVIPDWALERRDLFPPAQFVDFEVDFFKDYFSFT